MHARRFVCALCLVLASFLPLRADFGSPEEMAAEAKIQAVIKRLKQRAADGSLTAAKIAPELATLDQHIVEFAAFPEHQARFALTKALIHVEFLNDADRADALLRAVKRDYPDTQSAREVDQMLTFVGKVRQRNAASAELKPLLAQLQAKLKLAYRKPDEFDGVLDGLDALEKKYAKSPEAAGHIVFIKASFYLRLEEWDTGREILKRVIKKYPGTLAADSALQSLNYLDEHEVEEEN